jgi:hypothetical protein
VTIVPNWPATSTCTPWAAMTDVGAACTVTPGVVDADVQTNILTLSLQAASDTLFRLSGSQFAGSCADTVRPQARLLGRDHGRPVRSYQGPLWGNGSFMYGWSGAGAWWPFNGTTNQEELSDGGLLPSIDLGVYPLTGIIQVLIDGAVVDPTTYAIHDDRHLVRLGVEASPGSDVNPGWPYSQLMDLDSSNVNTFEVTFTYGVPPPPSGVMACAELGWQLYLSQTNNALCKLPARTTHITRQGLSAVLLDPLALANEGRTGLYICDVLFLNEVNPNKLRQRSYVNSPDINPRTRHVTWGPGA